MWETAWATLRHTRAAASLRYDQIDEVLDRSRPKCRPVDVVVANGSAAVCIHSTDATRALPITVSDLRRRAQVPIRTHQATASVPGTPILEEVPDAP